MAAQESASKSLDIVLLSNGANDASKKQKLKVLDEDTYTESLEKIITKDFFPDLPKLQAQAEYLDAIERKDTQKIWELQRKFSVARTGTATVTPGKYPSASATPSTFETPTGKISDTPVIRGPLNERAPTTDSRPTHNPEPGDVEPGDPLASTCLDKFLCQNTSEDNMSFSQIMAEAEKKRQHKNAWLYEKTGEQLEEREQNLALPPIEKQAIEAGSNSVQTWTYTAHNAVMYVPEGVPATMEEQLKQAGKAREIVHQNTRFTSLPFNQDKNKESIMSAASAQAKIMPGRVGPDGKEILPTHSPRVGGYGFVATPSPSPGVDASPLMTWGEIDGTPLRLDPSDTPLTIRTPGPTFKIPDIPQRDRLLREMAEKASKAHRAKKQEALRQVTASLSSPSPKFGSSRTDRLQFLSPAAQQLASKKLGIRTNSDKALQASYTPSPSHTPGGDTPITSPAAGSAKTPTSQRKRTEEAVASLTDNLLNLPKRAKAQEFF